MVTVKSMVDGPLIDVAYTEGQNVRAGDVLARIDPRVYQAALDNATAKKALDEATLANARRAVFEGPNVAAAQLQKEQHRLQTSEDAAEGVRSFIEKRPAKFLGR